MANLGSLLRIPKLLLSSTPSITSLHFDGSPALSTSLGAVRTAFGWTNWRMMKDLRKRKTVRMFAKERLRINSLRKNNIIPRPLQVIAKQEIHELPHQGSIITVVGRCVVAGRARGTFSRWRMCRMQLRHFADYNYLSGWQRARW